MPQFDPEYLRRETWSLIEAACLLAGDDPSGISSMLITDPGFGGRASHIYANLKDATDMGVLESFKERTGKIADRRVRPWDAVQWAKARGYKPPKELLTIPEPKPLRAAINESLNEPYYSEQLRTLILAAQTHWKHADRDQRDTHPDNKDVAAWLAKRGFSVTLAEKAATIIRPDWAPTGRKPDK